MYKTIDKLHNTEILNTPRLSLLHFLAFDNPFDALLKMSKKIIIKQIGIVKSVKSWP
jgi:hypothetical protein